MTKLCPLPVAPVPHTAPHPPWPEEIQQALGGPFLPARQPVPSQSIHSLGLLGTYLLLFLGSCPPLQPPLHATPKANSEPSPTPCAEGVVHTPIFAQTLILNEGSAHLKFASGFPLGKNAARAWTHATHPPCSLNSRSGLFLQPHFGSLYTCQPQSTSSCSVPEWTFLSIWYLLFFCPCHAAHGILVSQPGIEPTFPALEGRFSTTGPLGKTHQVPLNFHLFIFIEV